MVLFGILDLVRADFEVKHIFRDGQVSYFENIGIIAVIEV